MKLNHIMLIVLLTTSGCFAKYSGAALSLTGNSYDTSYGFKVYDQTELNISQQAIEEIIEHTMKHHGAVSMLKGYKVILVPELIKLKKWNSDEIIYLYGQMNPYDKFIVVSVFPDQCLAKTKLIHELQHVFHVHPIPDFFHDDTEWWKKMKAMEKDIQTKLCEQAE